MAFIHNFVETLDVTSKDTQKGRFYTTPEGNVYPSITTILGSYEKPALNAWIQSVGKDRANKEKELAAYRGTAVHDMCEKFVLNDPNPIAGHETHHIADFNSLKMYLKRINNVRGLELPLYSDTLKVAGRTDVVAEYDGELSIVDYKTSTNAKTADMIEDYFMQSAAYAIMFEERYGTVIENIRIVMSVTNGVPMVFKAKVSDWIEPLCIKVMGYHARNKQ